MFTALCALAAPRAAAHGVTPMERIDVTGHYDNSVGTSDAASQGVITSSLIDARPRVSPGSVLELVPGVVVTQHSGPGKANQYFLRGFNLDHGSDFATSVSGMPVNMPTHAHGQGYADLNFVIPELISRVDYRKGPYFATHGDFASAGAADIHYFDALKTSVLELAAGSFHGARALAAGTTRAGPGVVLGALEVERADGPWSRPDELRKLNAVLSLAGTGPDSKWKLSAMAYRGRWNATDQVPRRAIDGGIIDRFDAIDATDGGESSRYSLSGERWQAIGGAMLRLNAYVVRYHVDLFSNFTYFLDDPVNGDQFEQLERRTTVGADANWERQSTFLGRDASQALGLQLRDDRIAPLGLYRSAARERLATTREDRVRQTSVAAYAEQGVELAAKLRGIAGLRYDRYRFRVDSNLPANSGADTAGLASPKLTLVAGPWAKTEWFFNAGRGFHSNDARGATIHVDPASGAPVDRVDPLVKTRGVEAGVRSEHLKDLQLSMALWRLAADSELVFVGDAGTTEASRPSLRRGVELSARYRPAPWLLFDFDASFSRARFTGGAEGGDRIPGSIGRVVTAGVTLRDLQGWTASLALRHFGPRPLTEDGAVESGSSTLVNAHVARELSPSLRVAFDVFNLLDRKASDIEYFYASRLRGEPQAVEDVHLHPVLPRHYRLTLRIRF
jgi:outer membrane receptor protein involved in Fe transport